MTSPFCALAADYDARWDGSLLGGLQRHAVWVELKRVFQSGDRVLDVGCGTGTDALFLEARGVHVDAVDASTEMVRKARARGIPAEQRSIETLGAIQQRYDGALSNFGALNCVSDLRQVAADLALIVKPGGRVVLCMMNRFCWRETLTGLMRFDLRFAVRRWCGATTWRGITVYYPRRRDVVAAFAARFDLLRTTNIGGGDHRIYVFARSAEC